MASFKIESLLTETSEDSGSTDKGGAVSISPSLAELQMLFGFGGGVIAILHLLTHPCSSET